MKNKYMTREYISKSKITPIRDDIILIKISKFNFILLIINLILIIILSFQFGDLTSNINSLNMISNMDINNRKNAFIKLDTILN